jgi:carboxypeptidase family protein
MTFKPAIIVAFAVALFAAGPGLAGDKKEKGEKKEGKEVFVIKGKVVEDGKPQDGAEVHVRSLDRKEPDKVVETDSKGHYIVLGLLPGSYSVTAYDPDMVYARSRAIIKTNRKGWAKVDFDLGLDRDVGNDASRISGHEHFTQPNSHGAPISAAQ